LSSNLNATKNDVVRLQLVVGSGIQNYMNDSPVDVGIEANPGNAVTPVVGKPIPIVGIVAFVDHKWNDSYSTAVGYSFQDNDNTNGQAPDAFRRGHYALGNVPLLSRAQRHGRRRAAVGPPRELLGWVPQRRVQTAVLVQIQLLVETWRLG
jgi:hypothetical protein